jgi:hypothetical protein
VSLVLFSLSGRHPDQKGREAVGTGHRNKAGAAHQVARSTGAPSKQASMEFLIFEDNGGDSPLENHRQARGTLAESVSFASYEDAEQAARRVRDGVGSASFEPRAGGDQPVNLAGRRATAK